MSGDRNLADDAGWRTSLSWMRTGFAFVLVALLIERGLILNGSSVWGTLLVATTVGLLVVLVGSRSHSLRAGRGAALRRRVVVTCAISVAALSLVAVFVVALAAV